MSTVTTGSVCPCRYSWMFVWTVETTFEVYETRSSSFAYKGHEVHLRFTTEKIVYNNNNNKYYYEVALCTPASFPSLSVDDMVVRVETKNKTPLDLPNQIGVAPNNKTFWIYTDTQILEKYPDFRKDGGILTFLVCGVDPINAFRTAEKFVQTPEHFNDASSLEGLSADLSVLLKNQDSGPDLELLCGEDHSIKVHKDIVSARSKVISAMLKSDMSEGRTSRIVIKDMDSEIFDLFVHYLYEGKLPDLNVDIARGLYEAGDKYEVVILMKQCASFLEENMTPENALEMLLLAYAHGDQNFKERVIDFIVEQEIPKQDEQWLPFCESHPKLGNEVFSRFCKFLLKKLSATS